MLDDLNSRLAVQDDVNVFQIYDGKLEAALESRKEKSIRFRSREEIVDYLGNSNLYPVVEKEGDDYLLVGVFTQLDDAREFIQGTRYIIWYKPSYP